VGDSTGATAAVPNTDGTLARHSIGLAGAVAQSAALVGPAVAVVVGNAFIASLSGAASVLSFIIGTVICVIIAMVIGDFARELPSAGSFYTYLTRSFGAKTGFVTGVLLFGAYVLLFPFQLSFFGYYMNGLFQSNFSTNVPWEWFAVAMILISTSLAVLGVRYSLQVGLIGLAFEVTVFTIFAILVIAKGGAHGQSIQVLNPHQAPKGFASGLLIACVYTIFAFVGFESATTLGEEARDPRRTIPRAVMLSTVLLGAFLVVVTYAEVIGFGVSKGGINNLISDPNAFNTLAHRYGDSFLAGAMDVAVVSSFMALNIVTVNAVTRMLYAMGRDNMLPSGLARLNRRQAPWVAALSAAGVGIAASLIFGIKYHPEVYASWSAYFATLFFIGAYILLCVGVIKFNHERHGASFSIARHAAVPLVGLAGIGLVLYGNVHPLPPSPLRWFIPATAGVIAVAVAVAYYLERIDPGRVSRAGRLLAAVDIEERAVVTAHPATDIPSQIALETDDTAKPAAQRRRDR
jgi:amino acid transporter